MTVRCSLCNTDKEISSFARGRRSTIRKDGIRYSYACDDCASRIEEEHTDYNDTREIQNVVACRDGFVFRKLANQEGKRLIGTLINSGYLMVWVGDKKLYAHRLVYELFSGEAIPKTDDTNRPLVIAHLDDNKINNAFDNLHLITQSQNAKDAYQTGVGIRAPRIARAVVATNATTGEVIRYPSINKAAIVLNITPPSILFVCNGTRHTALSKSSGTRFRFRFAD